MTVLAPVTRPTGEPTCSGCDSLVGEYEEGRCASCRQRDRGDDRLVAHDSRGWLKGYERPPAEYPGQPLRARELVEVREPCQCGCGMETVPETTRNDPEPPGASGQSRELVTTIRPSRSAKYSDEDCLQALRDWATEHDGKPPSIRDWNAARRTPNWQTIAKHLGSWNDAIAAAGFEPNTRNNWEQRGSQATGKAHAIGSGERAHPWASAIQKMLDDAGEELEVRFRHELEPWQMELVAGTLGAHVVVDRQAPHCALPCARCDAIEREDAMDTETQVCKQPGCTRDATAKMGPYAGLCDDHAEQARKVRSDTARRSGGGSPRSNGSGMADAVRELLPLARKLDRLQGRLAALSEDSDAKNAVDEAIRRYQGVPSGENLAALNEATKAAAKGQPQREKLAADVDEADRTFKAALTKLARRAAG